MTTEEILRHLMETKLHLWEAWGHLNLLMKGLKPTGGEKVPFHIQLLYHEVLRAAAPVVKAHYIVADLLK